MARAVVKKVPTKFKGGRKGWCVLYDDGLIRIDGVRFSYPHLRKPYGGEDGGEAKYGVVGLLPKKGNEAAKLLIDSAIKDILTANKVKTLASDKKFIKDGDDAGKEEYEGHWAISARESRKPPLRSPSGETVEPEDTDGLFQAGYWGSILIRPWWQDHKKYGKRVNAGLSSAQSIAEDETFGEGRISDDDLDDIYEDNWDGDGDDSVDDEDEDEIDI